MKKDMILKKNENMVTRVIDDETILMPVFKTSDEINCIYTLNKCASRVWELIDGKRKISCIKEKILGEFDTDSKETDREIASLIKDLKEIKAIK